MAADLTGDIKLLTDSEGTVRRAKTVIIATGSGYRKLGLPKEDKFSGRGVSWCATCDGFFFRDRDIVVVGGGDTAMEEATFLTRFARSVTVVHRRSTLRASRVMQDRAFADDKISFAFDSEIAELKESGGMLAGVVLRDVLTGATRELDVTGLFIAIGHDPRTELFTGQIDLDDEGYIKVASPSTRTSLPGVFAAGDVVDHTYRQAITAAGTGSGRGPGRRALPGRQEGARAGARCSPGLSHTCGAGTPRNMPGVLRRGVRARLPRHRGSQSPGRDRTGRAATSAAYAAQSPSLACCRCTATERWMPSMRARIVAGT